MNVYILKGTHSILEIYSPASEGVTFDLLIQSADFPSQWLENPITIQSLFLDTACFPNIQLRYWSGTVSNSIWVLGLHCLQTSSLQQILWKADLCKPGLNKMRSSIYWKQLPPFKAGVQKKKKTVSGWNAFTWWIFLPSLQLSAYFNSHFTGYLFIFLFLQFSSGFQQFLLCFWFYGPLILFNSFRAKLITEVGKQE